MRKPASILLSILFTAAAILAGCEDDELVCDGYCDNPVTAQETEYCRAKCEMWNKCDPDDLHHSFGSVGLCEWSYSPVVDIETMETRARDEYPGDPDAQLDYLATHLRGVSLQLCLEYCVGYEASSQKCTTACELRFSQACADTLKAINDCYLNLPLERACLYSDFSGVLQSLDECEDTQAVADTCGEVGRHNSPSPIPV